MCGLIGFSHKDGINSTATAQKMCDTIISRGPNSNGIWHGDASPVVLGHRRLSIMDLSQAGHQPMASVNGRYVIAFNGEIYNHLDLRNQLEKQHEAPAWCGHSDTETLLACFNAWGIQPTLEATVGMFAIALWDQQDNTLTLARDRLGEKPLYWGWCNETLIFGSELKALKAHPQFNASIDRKALSLLLQFNYIPTPHCIYKGIQKLKAGHFIQLDFKHHPQLAVSKPYWSLQQTIKSGCTTPFVGTDEAAIEQLDNVISQSIRGQLLSDVPIGAFLSGGVDSSLITALLQRQSNQPVRTFAIGFSEPGYNEAEYAKQVAQHLGTDHTEFYVSAADALKTIPKLPHIYCEPFADSSQIPTFMVSQLAKQHVTVALTGDGGDELFGGYNTYQFTPKIWDIIRRIPMPLRKLVTTILQDLPAPDRLQKVLRVLPCSDREQLYLTLTSHWHRPEVILKNTILESESLYDRPGIDDFDCFEHWMMATDTSRYMTDDILVKCDRAAMANSLETRIPLLDHRVVEYAWSLPLNLKIRNGTGKWILRELLYRHVPRSLIDRPKKGFSIPLAQWLRGPLREWSSALLDEHRIKRDDFFNYAVIIKLWHEHLSGKRDHALKLWSILMFQAWLEKQ